MLQITPQMRILVAVEPADFRCGIDGLLVFAKKCCGKTRSAAACLCSVIVEQRPSRCSCTTGKGSGFVTSDFRAGDSSGGLATRARCR